MRKTEVDMNKHHSNGITANTSAATLASLSVLQSGELLVNYFTEMPTSYPANPTGNVHSDLRVAQRGNCADLPVFLMEHFDVRESF